MHEFASLVKSTWPFTYLKFLFLTAVYFYKICMDGFSAGMSVYLVCAQYLQRPEEGVRLLSATLWVLGLKPGPLEEPKVPLTMEPSLQLLPYCFKYT